MVAYKTVAILTCVVGSVLCAFWVNPAAVEAATVSAQVDEQYRFGSYTGPLEPSPPHGVATHLAESSVLLAIR